MRECDVIAYELKHVLAAVQRAAGSTKSGARRSRLYAMACAVAQAAQVKMVQFGQMLHLPGKRRRGSSTFQKGLEIVVIIIFLAIALYVAAYTVPGALTAMATSALTSVNTGVQTLFQVVVSLIAVVALILLLLGVVRSVFVG